MQNLNLWLQLEAYRVLLKSHFDLAYDLGLFSRWIGGEQSEANYKRRVIEEEMARVDRVR